MLIPTAAQYATYTLPADPDEDDLQLLIKPYQAMIVAQFRAILDRTERSKYYPWLDTKINLITGEDLPSCTSALGSRPCQRLGARPRAGVDGQIRRLADTLR